MSGSRFYKYQGAGNDFILFEEVVDLSPVVISRLCHRRKGIGADGVIVVDIESDGEARMRIFNADGSEATMCGNGLRCVARRMVDRIETRGGEPVRDVVVACGGKRYRASLVDGEIAVGMGWPSLVEEGPFSGRYGYRIDAGAPHLICITDKIGIGGFSEKARGLRYHDRFAPEGVNVGFASFLAKDHIRLRMYEKGVEGETLACGTGGTAVAFLAWRRYGVTRGIRVEFFSGEFLTFDVVGKDRSSYDIRMSGHAVRVFEGMLSDVSFSRQG